MRGIAKDKEDVLHELLCLPFPAGLATSNLAWLVVEEMDCTRVREGHRV